MPPSATRLYTGTAASSALLDASQRLHGSLMVLIQRGSVVQDDATCAVIDAVLQTVLHLEAQVGAQDYRNKMYTNLKPLSMIGFWYVCEDNVAHNLSEWVDDDTVRMACDKIRQPQQAVTEVTGQEFCDDCRVLSLLPGEVSDGYQKDTSSEGSGGEDTPA